jgi:hypothetical protein
MKLAILGLALAASTAHAQKKANYTRSQDNVKINVKLSDRVKPIQPKQQSPKEQKPDLSADQVLSIEGLVGTIRAEQEAILADLIQNTPDRQVDEKSNYYFMLGELYAKQQRFWRLKSVELTIQADTTKNSRTRQEAAAAADKAKQYLLKAVKTYKGLTDNEAFRNYPKMDMALFYYGYTLQGGRYMDEARKVYDKLLKN